MSSVNVHAVVEYILAHEREDFQEWLERGDSDLSEEKSALVLAWLESGSDDVPINLGDTMKLLARQHVYAAAALAFDEIN